MKFDKMHKHDAIVTPTCSDDSQVSYSSIRLLRPRRSGIRVQLRFAKTLQNSTSDAVYGAVKRFSFGARL